MVIGSFSQASDWLIGQGQEAWRGDQIFLLESPSSFLRFFLREQTLNRWGALRFSITVLSLI